MSAFESLKQKSSTAAIGSSNPYHSGSQASQQFNNEQAIPGFGQLNQQKSTNASGVPSTGPASNPALKQ